jgi:hypothetical protein
MVNKRRLFGFIGGDVFCVDMFVSTNRRGAPAVSPNVSTFSSGVDTFSSDISTFLPNIRTCAELSHKFPDVELNQYIIMTNHFHAIIMNNEINKYGTMTNEKITTDEYPRTKDEYPRMTGVHAGAPLRFADTNMLTQNTSPRSADMGMLSQNTSLGFGSAGNFIRRAYPWK